MINTKQEHNHTNSPAKVIPTKEETSKYRNAQKNTRVEKLNKERCPKTFEHLSKFLFKPSKNARGNEKSNIE